MHSQLPLMRISSVEKILEQVGLRVVQDNLKLVGVGSKGIVVVYNHLVYALMDFQDNF